MQGRECYHCKQWIGPGEPHDCWTTTEANLTRDLSEDLREAWERLRETAAAFGDQRIYASLNSIMFSRRSCCFFVRPKTKFLEVCFFLGRTLKAAQVHRTLAASRVKVAHIVQVRHRDEVEAPLTDWLQEAYDTSDALTASRAPRSAARAARKPKSPASRPPAASKPAPPRRARTKKR